VNQLREYLSELYKGDVEIQAVTQKGDMKQKPEEELKCFGYGTPYIIEFTVDSETRKVVLETMRPEGFGHDHFSDRAGILLWQHGAFNLLPKHVRSVDVGAFTKDESLKSVSDCQEFFVLTEWVKGDLYHCDLDQIRMKRQVRQLDRDRCLALSDYLVGIHSVKQDANKLYVRRVRELVGHGECVFGLVDSYPSELQYIPEKELCEIEKKFVEWRWRLKSKTHRLSQVHGDFHPWNIIFRNGVDFTVLDRSRGVWGDPADDVTALSINYLFYSLQTFGVLAGPFDALFRLFWENYLRKTGDEEILDVVQPFYAWRGLVIASPVWYPNLSVEVRRKLFNFIRNILNTERLDVWNLNLYLKD
jgi:tRNA A-37 threonylcarbamoyl transferase component Bud32